jgi:hypothetical protein
VSQVPDMTAAEWPEQIPGGVYPQVDTEPHHVEQDWAAPQQQAPAQWAGYQGYQEEQPAVVPTEFDHLFRDSPQDSRKSIDRSRPMVGGASAGFLDAAPQYDAPPSQQYAAPQQAPQPGAQPVQAPEYAQQGGYNGGQPGSVPGQGGYPTQVVGQGQPAQYGYPQDLPQYGAPGGPVSSGEWAPGQGAGGGGGTRRPVLIGAAVVAVVAVVAVAYGLSGGGSPAKSSTAVGTTTSAPAQQPASGKGQADQILALIDESGQLRQDASGAVEHLLSCQNLSSVQSTLAHTTATRESQAASVAKDDVSGIKDGSQLVQELQAAWTASAKSDSAYETIASDVQNSCSSANVKQDPNYTVAQKQGDAASDAKYSAAQLWNSEVTPLGEGKISSDAL